MKHYIKIQQLAERGQFTDVQYSNQLIVSLCKELISQTRTISKLEEELKERSNNCYVLMPKKYPYEPILFDEKRKADKFKELFDISDEYIIRTNEVFNCPTMANMKINYQFLRV